MTTADTFYQAQFEALRGEILYLMKANESRVFGAAGFATVTWGVIASMLSAKIQIPGIVFLVPGVVLFLALSVHTSYSKRIANISSFLEQLVKKVAPTAANWEGEIAQFAKASPVRLSSRVSVVSIYFVLAALGITAAMLVSATRLLATVTASSWVMLDLICSGLFGALILAAMCDLVLAGGTFSDIRTKCDVYWRARAEEWGHGAEV